MMFTQHDSVTNLGSDSPPIYVLQVGSAIGRPSVQLKSLRGLSLGRIGKVRRLEDTPATRGLVQRVSHLVLVLDYEPPKGMGVGQIVKQYRRRLGLSPRAFRAVRNAHLECAGAVRHKRSMMEAHGGDVASRILALEEATARLRAFREDVPMDDTERLKLAAEPRKIHRQLFDADPDVARQAAFALVYTSRSYGGGYHLGSLSEMPAETLERFRLDLQHLLPRLGDRFYSYIQTLELRASADRVRASFRLRLSRRLPFEVNGKPVIIDEAVKPLQAGDDVTVFSVPEATVKLGKRHDVGDDVWQIGDFFVLDCEIELPIKESDRRREIPIAFAIKGIGASTLKARLSRGFETKCVPFRASGSGEREPFGAK